MSSPKNKTVDLTLFRKMVSEFESAIYKVEQLDISTKDVQDDYAVELSKAMGLAGGISQECTMLVMDMSVLIKSAAISGANASLGKDDPMTALKSLFDLKSTPKGKN